MIAAFHSTHRTEKKLTPATLRRLDRMVLRA
jgi:hypothetical protein